MHDQTFKLVSKVKSANFCKENMNLASIWKPPASVCTSLTRRENHCTYCQKIKFDPSIAFPALERNTRVTLALVVIHGHFSDISPIRVVLKKMDLRIEIFRLKLVYIYISMFGNSGRELRRFEFTATNSSKV